MAARDATVSMANARACLASPNNERCAASERASPMARAMLLANRAASPQAKPFHRGRFAESVEMQPTDSVSHPSWCAIGEHSFVSG